MGRNTEIYMFHKENASTNLYKDLESKRLHKKTFKEFINERTDELLNYYIIFEDILSVINKDINNISPDYLFEIIYYLDIELKYGKYDNGNLHWKSDRDLRLKNEQAVNEIYKKYGISLLYKVHTSTVCYSYMFQFGNYTDFFPIKGGNEDGYNIGSKDFLMFNDYMILIMHKIIESGLSDDYDIHDFNRDEIDKVIQKYQADRIMQQCIENEFKWLKSCMSKDDDAYKAEKNTVYWAGLFLGQSLEMKLRINPEANPRIVIVDSI